MLTRYIAISLVLGLVCNASCAEPPEKYSETIRVVDAFCDLVRQSDDDIREQAKFLLLDSEFADLRDAMVALRKQVGRKRVQDIHIRSVTSAQLVYELKTREVHVDLKLSKKVPTRITKISTTVNELDEADTVPMTWQTAGAVMQKATAKGFSGALLLTRDGKVVQDKGYGLANRQTKIKNTKDTVFAIGSAPIDFTHAGILLLKDQGKLKRSDPITKFFDNVPDDKKSITIEQLMKGRSGLPDFHELPTDKNPDHDWIDRSEAIRRIMNQKLLFTPGEQHAHSHSGWGLLAAVIEIVSGSSYADFTTENLFKPAGMNDTGFFGDPVSEDRIAVGYGESKSSDPNSPPHWGKTSWLVMGSGGQVSTLADMYRWEVAMRGTKILAPESSAAYVRTSIGVSQDGDMFGFEFMHSKNPENLFLLISNSVDTRASRRSFDQLGRRLHRLVQSSKNDDRD